MSDEETFAGLGSLRGPGDASEALVPVCGSQEPMPRDRARADPSSGQARLGPPSVRRHSGHPARGVLRCRQEHRLCPVALDRDRGRHGSGARRGLEIAAVHQGRHQGPAEAVARPGRIQHIGAQRRDPEDAVTIPPCDLRPSYRECAIPLGQKNVRLSSRSARSRRSHFSQLLPAALAIVRRG